MGRVLLTAIALLVVTSNAWACQSNVSAFDSFGEVRLSAIKGKSQLVYVRRGNGLSQDQTYPFRSPVLRTGYGNYGDRPIDRIELVHVARWRHDPILNLESRASSVYWSVGTFPPNFSAFQFNLNVARYDFIVVHTVQGRSRPGFSVGRLEFPQSYTGLPGKFSFWLIRPPTADEDLLARSENLRVCRNWALRTGAACDEKNIQAQYEQALVYRPTAECSVNYGFRVGKEAVFYWRGDTPAGVAEVTPEARTEIRRL